MSHLVNDVHGSDTLMYKEDAISLKRLSARIAYLDAMKEFGGLERDKLLSFGGAQQILQEFGCRPRIALARARARQDLSNASPREP